MAAAEGGGAAAKLVGAWASPYAMRARIAFHLKGVEYECLEEALPNKSELLLKSNPVYKKVPVLLHHGKPICESLIIVQYIDEVWAASGPALLPADPYERAVHRFWAVYVDDKLIPSVTAVGKAETEEAKAEAAEQAIAGLKLLEGALEKLSGDKGLFFGGEAMGYLDIALGSCLGWLRVTEKMSGLRLLEEEKTPLLAGWAERFCAHEAVKGVMPETDKLMEFAKMLEAFLKSLQNQRN